MFYKCLTLFVVLTVNICVAIGNTDQQYIDDILNEYASKTGVEFSKDEQIMNLLSQDAKGLDPEIVLDSFLLTVRNVIKIYPTHDFNLTYLF